MQVEGAGLRLARLEMRHPLLGTTALRQQAFSHYMRAALPELVRLVGSANLLGSAPYHLSSFDVNLLIMSRSRSAARRSSMPPVSDFH